VSKLAFNWFGDKERGMATAIGSMSMPLGMLMSFILPSTIFDDSDKDN
jgi:sugar phosphate permease